MKTINENNYRKLSTTELSETKGGFWVIITLPDGSRRKIWF